jgi:PAS domain S-box-containing protein
MAFGHWAKPPATGPLCVGQEQHRLRQIADTLTRVRLTGGDPYGLAADRVGLGCEIGGHGGVTSYLDGVAGGFKVGGDVQGALASVSVPSYVLDTSGVVRWINPAAERLLGDVRGRHFTSVVAAEDRQRAREVFARKVLGTTPATDSTAALVSTDGTHLTVEISSAPLMGGGHVVGVFGLMAGPLDEPPRPPHPHLTPRQAEVLRLLEQGRSTKQIAAELHLSPETVRNHIRHLFRALGVNTRLEAVAAARHG